MNNDLGQFLLYLITTGGTVPACKSLSDVCIELDAFFRGMQPIELSRFDKAVRAKSWWMFPNIPTYDIEKISNVWVAGLLSFAPDGWTRQPAVRALSKFTSGDEIPFLYIRLNDWVPQIRNEAKEACLNRIRPENAAKLIRCFALAQRLRLQTRGNHQIVLDKIDELLQDPSTLPAIAEALQSPDRTTRRLAMKIAIGNAANNNLALVRSAARSTDPVLRLEAARHLRKHVPADELPELLEEISRDRFMPIQREALHGYVERMPDLAQLKLNEALFDNHSAIRQLARFFLRERNIDFAQKYRDVLLAPGNKTSRLFAAIIDIGELGNKSDAKIVTHFLHHERVAVRTAALRTLCRLDEEMGTRESHLALKDKSISVVINALRFFAKKPYLVDVDQLYRILMTDKRVETRMGVVRLAAKLTWWNSAVLLLSAAVDPDQGVSTLAKIYLKRWQRSMERLIVKARPDQVVLIKQLLENHSDLIGLGITEDIQSVLKHAIV